MAPLTEAARVARVYQHYHEQGFAQQRWSMANPGNRAIVRERTRLLNRVLDRSRARPLAECRILEIGCGVGHTLEQFICLGATPTNLYGIDLLFACVDELSQRLAAVHGIQANAVQLSFPAGCFDLVVASTVFTSVLEPRTAQRMAAEIERVLAPTGVVVWYDFRYNNPGNAHVRGLSRTAIQALFPQLVVDLQTATLLPPLARRLGRFTPLLYPLLNTMPWFRTHYLGILHR